MENVAFDVDGVLTDFYNYVIQKGIKFFKRNPKNLCGMDVKELFECSDYEYKLFWKKYLLDYSMNAKMKPYFAQLSKYLKQNNYNVFIITSRVFTTEDSNLGTLMRKVLELWLKKNHFEYDKIIYCKEEKVDDKNPKLKAIIDNNISIMCEDNANNIKDLSDSCQIIKINEPYNEKSNNKYNASSAYEVLNMIEKIHADKKKENYNSLNNLNQNYQKDNYKKSIYDYMHDSNLKNMNLPAMIYFDRKITFAEFFKQIDDVASSYSKIGVKENDVVSLCLPNVPEAVISFYALNAIGAICNFIHPLKSTEEIVKSINDTKSTKLVIIDTCNDKLKNIDEKCNLDKILTVSAGDSMPVYKKIYYENTRKDVKLDYKITKITKFSDFVKCGKNQEYKKSIFILNKTAVLLSTGGSTGISKCVELSNENFNSMVEQFKFTASDFKTGELMATIMPVFHGFGLCSSVHLPLSYGVGIVLIPKFNDKELASIFKKYNINHMLGVPTLWKKICMSKNFENLDLSSLKNTVAGGDALEEKSENEFNEFLFNHKSMAKITKGYGLAEAVAGVSFTSNGYNYIGSSGVPMIDTKIKLYSDEEKKFISELYKNGEICVNGPTVMKGYYNNKEETANSLKIHNDDVWLHTGDVGYFDERGCLYVTGRMSRNFKSSGVNVYPNQINLVVLKHPCVDECVTFPIPNKTRGLVPKIEVVLNKNFIESNEKIRKDILELCKKNLDIYHYPYEIDFVESLPITKMGKIDYNRIVEENKNNCLKLKLVKEE